MKNWAKNAFTNEQLYTLIKINEKCPSFPLQHFIKNRSNFRPPYKAPVTKIPSTNVRKYCNFSWVLFFS